MKEVKRKQRKRNLFQGFYFARNGLSLSKSSGVFMAISFSLHNHARVTWSRVKAVWHGWHLTRNGVRYGGDLDPLCASPFRIIEITFEIQKRKKLKKHRSENVQLILFLFCYILGKICLKEMWEGDRVILTCTLFTRNLPGKPFLVRENDFIQF